MSYPIRYCCLREAAEGAPYSQEYLSLLARSGRLEAIKRGRNWYTTAAAIGSSPGAKEMQRTSASLS